MKQLSLLPDGALYHFRSHDGKEVDFVIERKNGRLLGIEVKSSEKVSEGDLDGLRALRELVGKDFARGIILYLGAETLSFGDDLVAMPIDNLWGFNMDVTADNDIQVRDGSIMFWATYGERTRIRCRIYPTTIEDHFFDGDSGKQVLQAAKKHWHTIWPIFMRKIRNGQIESLVVGGQKVLETRLDPSDFNYRDFRKA
jgi:hypothetical protein